MTGTITGESELWSRLVDGLRGEESFGWLDEIRDLGFLCWSVALKGVTVGVGGVVCEEFDCSGFGEVDATT